MGRRPYNPTLTEREETIIALICAGATNKEIERTLPIGQSTLQNHVANIKAKLEARTLPHAAALYTKKMLT